MTKAMNLGWRSAQGEYLFFLHEDTELTPETVRVLAARLESDADVGAVCPMLVTAHGNPAPQVGDLPPDGIWRPVFGAGQVGMPENPPPVEVDCASGAALMIRRFYLTAMRQIDERYGQYGSDADLCFQVRSTSTGYRCSWHTDRGVLNGAPHLPAKCPNVPLFIDARM